MIRVATFDELDPKLVKDLCKILYQAFAVGAEHTGVDDRRLDTAVGPLGAQHAQAMIERHQFGKAGEISHDQYAFHPTSSSRAAAGRTHESCGNDTT